jgi:formylglycine-generating enzyme required for sulfatase activity
MRPGAGVAIACASAATACSLLEPDPLPPHGEALIFVDTDLPVPRAVSRLRIDVYAQGGAWIASRDDVRPDLRDWPASFSLVNEDAAQPKTLTLRLRAYPDGRTTPYIDGPRLVLEGADRTPADEPDPAVTVDRLVRVRLVHGQRGRVRVVLRGGCAGVPASFETDATCIEAPPLAPVEEAASEPTLDRDVPSVAGAYGDEPCDGVALSVDRVCVPGGAFLFGDAFYLPAATGAGRPVDARPERIVRVTRFAMDRHEVSVARYRAALARGFTPPLPPESNDRDGPPGLLRDEACTFSDAPRGREGYPLSCVAWETARAFCLAEGGDLPSEAQWEYAAVAAGRAQKTTYPWGDSSPSCGDAVYGRSPAIPECQELGEGLAPLDAPRGDESAVGVRDLAGSLEEHLRDSHARFSAACWTEAPIVDPVCEEPPPPGCEDTTSDTCRFGPGWVHSVRGGSWFSPASDLRSVSRSEATSSTATSPLIGFRCVYGAH